MEHVSQETPPRRGRLRVAFALLLLSLGARFAGIDYGLPHHGEADAYLVKQAESMMRGGLGNRQFAGWKYPHLVGSILALAHPEPIERLGPNATQAEHEQLATRLRLRGRMVVAAISSVAAPATYFVAARFLSARFAFLAGLLVASSLLHICFSTQARPHGVISTFTTLALLASIRWREKPSLGRALVLGLSVAASVSTLHSGAAALAPMGAALLGLLRSAVPKGRVLLGSLLALTIVGVSAGWFYTRAEDGYGLDPERTPGAIAERSGGLGDKELDKVAKTGRGTEATFVGERVIHFSGHAVSLSRFNGDGFTVAFETLRDYDPALLVFSAIGLLGLLAAGGRRKLRGPSAVWITLAYGVPTFLVFGIYQFSMDRFYLALTPVTCMLAAFGASWLWERKISRVVTGAFISIGVASMATAAVLAAQLRIAPDTYTLAAEAIEELSADTDPLIYTAEIVGLPLMALPKFLSRDAMWSRGPWDNYQYALLYPKRRGVQGEPLDGDLSLAAAPREAALRLGRRIQPAPSPTRLKVFYAEDRAKAAGEALDEVNADIVLIGTSLSLGYTDIGPATMRDAWKESVRADGRWRLERTIKNSDLEDHEPVGYRMTFMGAFQYYARGTEIEVWVRR